MCACGRPTGEFSHKESDRGKTKYFVINSVLFGFDPADHFGKFGSQME